MGLEITNSIKSIEFKNLDEDNEMMVSITHIKYKEMIFTFLDKNDLELIYNHLKIALNK
tara:strand:+ start:70 stop:246 length:177 start_codon:yes stop_codon:yes gene_type:complete